MRVSIKIQAFIVHVYMFSPYAEHMYFGAIPARMKNVLTMASNIRGKK